VIILKKINLKKHITTAYLKWMLDPEIQKYTEQKNKNHNLKKIKKFVEEKNKSKNEFLYGIFLKEKFKISHIGNIKLGPVNLVHKNAYISYFIGEKKLWGRGYAYLAIKQIIKIAKKKGVKKIKAGLYEMNKGSEKVLVKNGFKVEGKIVSELVYEKKRCSRYIYGKVLR